MAIADANDLCGPLFRILCSSNVQLKVLRTSGFCKKKK